MFKKGSFNRFTEICCYEKLVMSYINNTKNDVLEIQITSILVKQSLNFPSLSYIPFSKFKY